MILYSCVTTTSISRFSGPMLQGLVHLFDGRMHYSGRTEPKLDMQDTYVVVCAFLKKLRKQ